jgi:nucleotide-binding universal stress UspA family protein
MPMQTIVLATDGSDPSRYARLTAAVLARALDASVLVLAVVEPELFDAAPDQELVDSMESYLHQVVHDEADALEAAGVSARGRVVAGTRAWRSIVDVAVEHHADLIVMGSHGRTGLARAAMGSVAAAVVEHSTLPVVVVPYRERADG